MIYVVWIDSGDGEFGWFYVFASKKLAMNQAQDHAKPGKKVVYISDRSKKELFDYDATKTVVVEQKIWLYHGA